jgi:hypothetical protein
MKHARFVRTLGLFSMFGFAVALVGCGSESQQPAGENSRQVNREFFKAKTSQNKVDAGANGRAKKR